MSSNKKQQQKKKKAGAGKTNGSAPTGQKKEVKRKRNRANRKRNWNVARVAANPQYQIIPLKTAVPTIDFIASVNSNALVSFATGWLSVAMSKGAVSRLASTDIPFAFQFICAAMQSAVSGANMITGNCPLWFRNVMQALQPKIIEDPSGKNSYSFEYSSSSVTNASQFPIGPTVWGYVYNWRLPDLTEAKVNGFPVCALFTGNGYTDKVGATSFQKIAELMASNEKGNSANSLVPSAEVTKYLRDVSAFAVASPELGFGGTGSGTTQPGGCFSHKLQLEVPIHHPILACVGAGTSTDNRFPSWQTSFGGDPCFLSAALSSFLLPEEMGMKHAPKFHTVDFMEFLDVMAQWVQGIQTSAATEESDIDFSKLQCPLTLQEMGLLLRNIMMEAFKDTQPAVQGMGPFKPTQINDNYFMPFLCGPGTCPIVTTPMMLPVPIIENVRALVRRKIKLDPDNAANVCYFIPILGKNVHDTLDQADYTYTVPGGETPVTYDSFKDPTSIWRKKIVGAKGAVEYKNMIETEVDYIDGAGGSDFLAINDPDQLQSLTAEWNRWLTEQVVGSHSCKLSQWSTELGISILTSVDKTRHVVNALTATHKTKEQFKETLLEDTRKTAPRNRSVVNGPFSLKTAIVDTSTTIFDSASYESVISTWILPINYVSASVSPPQSTKVQRMQAFNREKNSQSLTASDDGILMSVLHARYAAKMVKGRLSQTTQWDDFFQQMEKLGRGGILSSLVGGLAKSIFPNASGVIDSIATALPI